MLSGIYHDGNEPDKKKIKLMCFKVANGLKSFALGPFAEALTGFAAVLAFLILGPYMTAF